MPQSRSRSSEKAARPSAAIPDHAERSRRSAGLENQVSASAATSGLIIQPVDEGYTVTGRGFGLHLARTGDLTDISCGGRPLFDRAYLEVRDKTWHIKLQPKAEQVQMFPPHPVTDGQRFHYTVQIDDTATGIRLGAEELVTVHPEGVLDVVLTVVPQAQFEARRISWNLEFAADRFADRALSWQHNNNPQQTLQFPRQQAQAPQMARNFDWVRLNDGGGPVDIRFSASGDHSTPVPVENVLEDLRWWNNPRFWIADAVPYPHQDGDANKTILVPAGEARTLHLNLVMHCANRS